MPDAARRISRALSTLHYRHFKIRKDAMSFETIKYEAKGPVGVLTLNRPARLNAMTQGMLSEINDALDLAEKDQNIRALIITGSGTSFSSGFDLKEQMERRPQGVAEWRKLLD